VRAAARAPLGELFSGDDYPVSAIRNQEEGRVAYRMIIAPDGRVAACRIEVSSGSDALDGATCRILRVRARFLPARDRDGLPTWDVHTGRVSWVLPPPPAIPALALQASEAVLTAAELGTAGPAPWPTLGYTLSIDETGRVTECLIDPSGERARLAEAVCAALRDRARYSPALDGAGAPMADEVVGAVVWAPSGTARQPRRDSPVVAPAAALADAPSPNRAMQVRPLLEIKDLFQSADYPAAALARRQQGRVSFAVAVGADGRVTNCRIRRSSGSALLDAATCRIVRERARYSAARNARGEPIAAEDSAEVIWDLAAG
jgi:TonB family protein